MPSRIFISYSKNEPTPAQNLARFLTSQGYSVWWDTNLTSGEVFRDVIDSELNAADAVIVIWTRHSVSSKWVIAEADHAARQNKLITVRSRDLEAWRIPKPYNTYQAGDADDRRAVLAAVQRLVGDPAAPARKPAAGPAQYGKAKRTSGAASMPYLRLLLLTAVLAAGATLGLTSLKVPSAAVELDAESTALTIKPFEATTLAPFLAGALTVSGPGKVETDGNTIAFRSSFSIKQEKSAPITVQELKLERGDALWLRKTAGAEKNFEFSIEPSGHSSLTAFAQGTLQIDADGKSYKIQSAAPQFFEFSLTGPTNFALSLAEPEWTGGPFLADKLSFADNREKEGVPIAFSALTKGLVRFSGTVSQDGKSKELMLESGERLNVKPKNAGSIRALKLSSAGIGVVYSGEVTELTAGDESAPASLMPTYLAYYNWLGTALTVAAAAAGLLLAYLQLLASRPQKS